MGKIYVLTYTRMTKLNIYQDDVILVETRHCYLLFVPGSSVYNNL